MIDPRLVSQTIALMEQHPDATIEDDPPGMVDAVLAEQERRAGAQSQQSIMDSGNELPPTDASKITAQEQNQRRMGLPENKIMDSSRVSLKNQRDELLSPLSDMANPKKPVGAAIQGGAQGATLGFVDELAGAGNAIVETVKDPGISGQGTIDAYKAGRDPLREDFKTATKEQPGYTAGGMLLGGGVAPIPRLGEGGAMIQGGKVGGMAGFGMNEDLSRLPQNVEEGMMGGAVLGRAAEKIGSGIEAGGQWLGDKADDLLAAALKIPVGSKEYMQLKNFGLLDGILAKVRGSSEFPYGAGATRERIQQPAIDSAQAGTDVNPDLEVPALSGPQSLDAAYTAGYMRPKTRPAPNQMPFEDRVASDKLGETIKTGGSGLMPSTGLQPSTLQGGLYSAVMSRGEMVGGVGFSRIANAMRSMVNDVQNSTRMTHAGSGPLLQLIDAVEKSNTPDLDDYLAQEMSPEYKALRLEAADAASKEDK
jgi:hypothetical protein